MIAHPTTIHVPIKMFMPGLFILFGSYFRALALRRMLATAPRRYWACRASSNASSSNCRARLSIDRIDSGFRAANSAFMVKIFPIRGSYFQPQRSQRCSITEPPQQSQ
jgi:hypothetical protein